MEQRAAPRRADALQRVEDRLPRPRAAALAVEPEREAVRLVADPLQELEARARSGRARIGCDRPGTNTSSTRFASAITATRCRSCRCSAASAAESWPLPPSTTMQVRRGRERLVVALVAPGPSASRASRRPTTSSIAAKSSCTVPHAELAVVRLLRQRVLERRPSSRPSTCPGSSRCRSTRCGSAGSPGSAPRAAPPATRRGAAASSRPRTRPTRARAARSARRGRRAAASRRARRAAPRRASRAARTAPPPAPTGRPRRAARRSPAARSASVE